MLLQCYWLSLDWSSSKIKNPQSVSLKASECKSESLTSGLETRTRTRTFSTTTPVTSTAGVSAQVDAEKLRLAAQVEVIVGCVRGDVVVGDQSQVKLEPSVLLVDDVENLLQTQPVFSCAVTSRRKTQVNIFKDIFLSVSLVIQPARCPKPSA